MQYIIEAYQHQLWFYSIFNMMKYFQTQIIIKSPCLLYSKLSLLLNSLSSHPNLSFCVLLFCGSSSTQTSMEATKSIHSYIRFSCIQYLYPELTQSTTRSCMKLFFCKGSVSGQKTWSSFYFWYLCSIWAPMRCWLNFVEFLMTNQIDLYDLSFPPSPLIPKINHFPNINPRANLPLFIRLLKLIDSFLIILNTLIFTTFYFAFNEFQQNWRRLKLVKFKRSSAKWTCWLIPESLLSAGKTEVMSTLCKRWVN